MKFYENEELRQVTGNILHPGGYELTEDALCLCAFAPGSRLLEAGCGPGAVLKLLLERGYSAVGLDKSAPFLAEARLSGLNELVRGDLTALPFKAESLDGIICECVLSLIADKASALRECARVLRPGGKLALSDIVLQSETGLAEYCCSGDSCAEGAVSAACLEKLMGESGFTLVFERDYTRALKELSANLIWHFGAAARKFPCFSRRGISYRLFIARRD